MPASALADGSCISTKLGRDDNASSKISTHAEILEQTLIGVNASHR